MADYISRDAAIAEILSEPTDAHYPSWYAEKLKQIPTADARPAVMSRWIEIDDYVLCANCGVAEHSPNRNYCHGCGADMRKAVEIEQVKEAEE